MSRLKRVEKEFITNILIGFVDSHTNMEGIVPEQYEDKETFEEVAICKDILEKLNMNNGGIKLKKAFQLFIFTLSLLIFSSNVNIKALNLDNSILTKYVTNYKELPAVIVELDKTFTISFNKDINKDTVNRNTIKVLDSTGKEVNVSVVTRSDNNKVAQINAPIGGYINKEKYTLIVTKGVLDTKNKPLGKEIVMEFKARNIGTVVDVPKEDSQISEDEIFIDNLYKTNSPYWDQGAKFIDGKLNLNYYDYTTQKSSWKTLSTSFNPNINKQVIDTFKSLYTEKEGYQTLVSYSPGNNNTGLSSIEFYGKGLTPWGESFINFMFFDSAKSTDKGTSFIVSIPKCTKENYNNNNYRIKNALGAALNSSYSEQIFNYIDGQYRNTVLADNDEYIVISKTFDNFKVIVNSYNKSLYAEIIKL